MCRALHLQVSGMHPWLQSGHPRASSLINLAVSRTDCLTVLVSTTMKPHSGGLSWLRGPTMRDRGAVRGQRAALMGTTLGYGAVFFARTLKLRADASTLTILASGNLQHNTYQQGNTGLT